MGRGRGKGGAAQDGLLGKKTLGQDARVAGADLAECTEQWYQITKGVCLQDLTWARSEVGSY